MASSPDSRRVVITGMGVICPLGNSLDELWAGLTGRRSAVGRLAWVDGQRGLPTNLGAEAKQFAGEIDDFGPLESSRKKAIRKALKLMCRETQMGVAAAQRALAHAGLVDETTTDGRFESERTGIVFGSDYMLTEADELSSGVAACLNAAAGLSAPIPQRQFEYPRWGSEGMRQMTPLWLLKYLPNMPACHVAIYNDLRGPSNSLTHREAASNAAIGEALRTIQRGSADIMIAGATGTRIHPMKSVHALLLEETATGVPPEKACRPFDRDRCGAVLGEGAGAIVLESLESAQRRGAKILAEVLGFGSSTVVDRQRTAHRDRATVNAIRTALGDAKLSPEQVGHVHAHGLSTRSADADEARALGEVFGSAVGDVPVAAAKSNFGNLGAGSGTVELVASVLALEHGRLFPVLNYESPDPACPVRPVTRDDEPAGRSFVNVSFTPQGQATVIVVGQFA